MQNEMGKKWTWIKAQWCPKLKKYIQAIEFSQIFEQKVKKKKFQTKMQNFSVEYERLHMHVGGSFQLKGF